MFLNLLSRILSGKEKTRLCQNPLIIAHRGAPGYDTFKYARKKPIEHQIWENTISAFKNAYHNGAEAIEMDIHLTKDDQIIIIHDKTLNRTTNAEGYISNHTTQDLQKVYTNQSLNEHLPTLEEVFQEFKDGIKYIIEIKPLNSKKKTKLIISKMLSLIEKYNLKDQCYVISFYPIPLLIMKNNPLDIPTGLIVYKKHIFSRILLELAFYLGVDSLNFFYKDLNEKLVKKCRKAGFKIGTWTVNSKEIMDKMLDLKIDYITSDFFFTTK
jgi:glycerophosphoryl diester phosphodiesterase